MNVKKYQCLDWPKYNTIKEYFDYTTKKNARNVAFVDIKTKDQYTYKQVRDKSRYISYALNNLLENKKTHCAIISENQALYEIAYFSIVLSNNVVVLIDNELNDETMYKQINYADIEVVFLSTKNKIKAPNIIANCPNIKHVILLSNQSDEAYKTTYDLEKIGQENKKEAKDYYKKLAVNPDEMCELIYTSGTTGANKGVMLSNRNICCSLFGTLVHFYKPIDTISLLPFHHAYESVCHLLSIFVMGTTNYINDDFLHMMKNIKEYPAILTAAVPLIPETIAHRIETSVKRLHVEKYFYGAIKFSNALRKIGIDNRENFFASVLKDFNKNFRCFGCGGAPMSIEAYDLLTSVGFTIINGYGISECAPLVACNYLYYQRRGSAGHAIPDVEIRIVNTKEDGNGEITVKGDNVMLGYYKDQDSTKKVLKNGWLYTGDIGHLDKDGFLYICGRSKNLIILPNGKNVYPEELEELLVENIKIIKECIVYSDKDETGIYATVYLDEEYAKGKYKEEMYNELKKYLIEFNKKMPAYKRISDIKIRTNQFKKSTTQKILRIKSNMEE